MDDRVLDNVAPLGKTLKDALTNRFGQHPYIGDIRGVGLFQGIEIVQDRETKAPFDPNEKLHAKLKSKAFEAGLICYPMGGTLDGKHGDHILLAPPFIASEAQIMEIVDKLEQTFNAVLPN
jgi:adenosylmethionine-8-amino-7-oxononanoate aminotransferase